MNNPTRSTSVWATGWMDSVNQAATPTAIARGAQLQHDGAVGQITLTTGRILARINVKNTPPRRTQLRVRPYPDHDWRRIINHLATNASTVTAFHNGAVPHDLADPSRTASLPLLPTPDEIAFDCDCHTLVTCCLHAAALTHAVADRLQANPSLLFTVRGMAIPRLLNRLSPPSTAATANKAQAHPPGSPLPASRTTQHQTNSTPPPRTPTEHPTRSTLPPSTEDQAFLRTEAAHRARRLLAGTEQPTATDPLVDAVRTLATPLGLPRLSQVAERAGRSPAQLKQALLAHRHNGLAGAHTVIHPLAHRPPRVDAALRAIAGIRTVGGELRVGEGHITDAPAGIQLRYGPDSRWHPYTAGLHGHWIPAPGADTDPQAAYDAARTVRRQRRRA
ncbi:SWIM zinc finger family protein [Streptomyces sp. NPDC054933]